MTRLLALCAIAALTGCYSYTPGALGDVSNGDQVRALLTATQFDELEEHLVGGDREIEGEVIEATPQSILLEVPVVSTVQGIRVQSLNQRFNIPAAGVADLQIREINKPRTYGAIGIAALVLGVVVYDQFFAQTGQTPDDPTPPPPEDRVWRIRIPWIR